MRRSWGCSREDVACRRVEGRISVCRNVCRKRSRWCAEYAADPRKGCKDKRGEKTSEDHRVAVGEPVELSEGAAASDIEKHLYTKKRGVFRKEWPALLHVPVRSNSYASSSHRRSPGTAARCSLILSRATTGQRRVGRVGRVELTVMRRPDCVQTQSGYGFQRRDPSAEHTVAKHSCAPSSLDILGRASHSTVSGVSAADRRGAAESDVTMRAFQA